MGVGGVGLGWDGMGWASDYKGKKEQLLKLSTACIRIGNSAYWPHLSSLGRSFEFNDSNVKILEAQFG